MKVKVGDQWFDSDLQPIMVIVEEKDRDAADALREYPHERMTIVALPDAYAYDAGYINKWLRE